MGHLIVTRGRGRRDWLRSYRVLVNGKQVDRVRASAAAHVELPDGLHRLQLTIDGWCSPARIVLIADAAPTIANCSPGPLNASAILHRRAARNAYIALEIINAEEVARGFLHMALRRFGNPSSRNSGRVPSATDIGITAGDLSILFAACRRPDGMLATVSGSSNHKLWSQLIGIGWLRTAPLLDDLPLPMQFFELTDYGRIELLDILAAFTPN